MGGASSFDGAYGGARYLSADDNAGSCLISQSQQTTTTGPGVGGHRRNPVVLELLPDIISFK